MAGMEVLGAMELRAGLAVQAAKAVAPLPVTLALAGMAEKEVPGVPAEEVVEVVVVYHAPYFMQNCPYHFFWGVINKMVVLVGLEDSEARVDQALRTAKSVNKVQIAHR
jgi:hypothetical protein